jgi:hypothetical protein
MNSIKKIRKPIITCEFDPQGHPIPQQDTESAFYFLIKYRTSVKRNGFMKKTRTLHSLASPTMTSVNFHGLKKTYLYQISKLLFTKNGSLIK